MASKDQFFGIIGINTDLNTTINQYLIENPTGGGSVLMNYLIMNGVSGNITIRTLLGSDYNVTLTKAIQVAIETENLKEEINVTNTYGTTNAAFSAGVEVSTNELDGLIQDSKLEPGQSYIIKSADFQYNTDVIIRATSKNTLAKEGYGKFYNAKYDGSVDGFGIWTPLVRFNVTDINGTFVPNDVVLTSNNDIITTGQIIGDIPQNGGYAFVTNGGEWLNIKNWSGATSFTGQTSNATAQITDLFVPEYQLGSTVIWGNAVWVNKTGEIGYTTDSDGFNLDTDNWLGIEQTSANESYYNVVWDQIEYDVENNFITMRKDKSNNIVRQTFWEYWDSESRFISVFQWGNDLNTVNYRGMSNNVIDNSSVNLMNFRGQVCISNTFKNQTYFGYGTVIEVGTRIRYNNFDYAGLGYSFFGGEYIDFNNNTFINSSFYGNSFTGWADFEANIFNYSGFHDNNVANSYIGSNQVLSDSYISYINMNNYSEMYGNTLNSSSYMDENNMINSNINNNTLNSTSGLLGNSLNSTHILNCALFNNYSLTSVSGNTDNQFYANII